MENLKCEKVTTNSLTAKMPEPPAAIRCLLEEYQSFLGSVFEREYKSQNYNMLGTVPLFTPKLTNEEITRIKTLTEKLHSMPEWKDFTKECKRWSILM